MVKVLDIKVLKNRLLKEKRNFCTLRDNQETIIYIIVIEIITVTIFFLKSNKNLFFSNRSYGPTNLIYLAGSKNKIVLL